MLRKISMVSCFTGWLLYIFYELVLIGREMAVMTILASMLYGGWVVLMMDGEDVTD